ATLFPRSTPDPPTSAPASLLRNSSPAAPVPPTAPTSPSLPPAPPRNPSPQAAPSTTPSPFSYKETSPAPSLSLPPGSRTSPKPRSTHPSFLPVPLRNPSP